MKHNFVAHFSSPIFLAHTFLMKKYKTKNTERFKVVELKPKMCLISNRKNRMPLTLVYPGWVTHLKDEIAKTMQNSKNMTI